MYGPLRIMFSASLVAMSLGLSGCGGDDALLSSLEFEDDNFKQCILDRANNLGISRVSEMTVLNCYDRGIGSIKGIEQLKALTELNLAKNYVRELDLSKNPVIKKVYMPWSYQPLTLLNISNNPALEVLSLAETYLTSIDVRNNPNLVELNLGYNKLTAIDISHNPFLVQFTAQHNSLTEIDLGENTVLERLDLSENRLTTLNLDANTALHYANLQWNAFDQATLLYLDSLNIPELVY